MPMVYISGIRQILSKCGQSFFGKVWTVFGCTGTNFGHKYSFYWFIRIIIGSVRGHVSFCIERVRFLRFLVLLLTIGTWRAMVRRSDFVHGMRAGRSARRCDDLGSPVLGCIDADFYGQTPIWKWVPRSQADIQNNFTFRYSAVLRTKYGSSVTKCSLGFQQHFNF